MVSRIGNEVKLDLLRTADTGAETPDSRSVQAQIPENLRGWFEPAALADVQQLFNQANDPETKAELVQLVPAPVLKYLGLVV